MSSRSRRGGRRGNSKRSNDGWEEFGGYMNAKIQKLQNQFVDEASPATAKKSNIFNGISIFVNGFTKPPSDVLKNLMQEHGGTFHHYYIRERVTHIIAINLPNSKIAALTDQKIVKPEWITESIAANKLLPYQDYQLYKGSSGIQPSVKRHISATKTSDETSNTDNQKDIADEKVNQDFLECNNTKGDVTVSHSTESKSPEFRSPSKAGDAEFVSEFYNHSRLHHLSTWGAEFKAYVGSLQDKLTEFPLRVKLKEIVEKRLASQAEGLIAPAEVTCGSIFMHIDMDCFFVSVGLRGKAHLKGKPVAVTHSRGKGKKPENPDESAKSFHSMAEIASCSYEARAFGVKNGMFMGEAKKLCPDLTPINYDFEGYNEVSKLLYDTVASLTCEIEAVSCDELLVDCTTVLEETGATPDELAQILRQHIESATQCTASAGLGHNLLMARLATRKAKPNGQLYVSDRDVNLFMQDQPVENLPGVGRKIKQKLHSLGLKTCLDLQARSKSELQRHFGPKMSDSLHSFCRGLDDRKIQSEKIRKSVSAEINYGIRFSDWQQANKFVKELCQEVTKRLKNVSSVAKTITLKLKIRSSNAPKESAKFLGHGICDSINKGTTLPVATDSVDVITKEVMSLIQIIDPEVSDLRGIGIQLSKLEKKSNKKGISSGILKYTCKQPTDDSNKINDNNSSKTAEEILPPENEPTPEVEELSPVSTSDDKSPEIAACQNRSFLPPLPTLSNLVSPSDTIQQLAFQSNSDSGIVFSPHVTTLQRPQMSQKQEEITLPPDSETDLVSKAMEMSVSPSKLLDIKTLKQASVLSPQKSPAKRGRGRGRGAKSSKWVRSSHNAHSTKTQPESNTAENPSNKQPRKQLFDESDNQSTHAHDFIYTCEDSADGSTEIVKKKPNLCGATSLEEVKELMKQWIAFSAEPNDEDIAMFSSYLVELIDDKNLEQLFLLLRFLMRHIKRTEQNSWKLALQDMISNVQTVVKVHYNSILKL